MFTRRSPAALIAVAYFLFYPSTLLPQMGGGATMGGNAVMGGGVNYNGSWSDYVRRATLAVGIIQNDALGKRFVTGGGGSHYSRFEESPVYCYSAPCF
jgi:hypothetical protein